MHTLPMNEPSRATSYHYAHVQPAVPCPADVLPSLHCLACTNVVQPHSNHTPYFYYFYIFVQTWCCHTQNHTPYLSDSQSNISLLSFAASRPLPSGRAPFVALLGVYGRGVSHGGGDEGGADCCYVLHADGSLTIWLRMQGE